jgi:hypothetical protein
MLHCSTLRGLNEHTQAVKGCKGQSRIRVRSAGGCCFCIIRVQLKVKQVRREASEDVGFRSEKNQSGAKSTMGKAKLDESGGCTQAARLSSIEKENGSRATCEMGESVN